ncbi:MAG TPA: TonB family protein [Pyrinomonadaceae bacterium]|nr:TonB family protein [Pyrinomonadaceae bacterium]
MRRLLFSSITLLILLSITLENQISAQHRRARTRTRTHAVSNATTVQEIDRGTPEERGKLAEECSSPDRAKPEVEIGKNGNPTLCGKAISLPKPAYPENAKAQKVSGTVAVSIVIDEKGRVIWAQAVDGPPLLRQASVKAACQSLHSPTKISDRAVKVLSVVSYHFVNE